LAYRSEVGEGEVGGREVGAYEGEASQAYRDTMTEDTVADTGDRCTAKPVRQLILEAKKDVHNTVVATSSAEGAYQVH
jgi:hypothetical protein